MENPMMLGNSPNFLGIFHLNKKGPNKSMDRFKGNKYRKFVFLPPQKQVFLQMFP
jgi:hypothetical protein